MSSIAHRLSSTFAISAKSRATLVELDPDLTKTKKSTFKAICEVPSWMQPQSNLVNHILDMFCVKWLKMSKGRSQIDHNPSEYPSPWILPVYVVSNRQDKDLHPITKIAKCTIDTGNMQGNIVSRDFVENVLEFPSTKFMQLTDEKEKGGISITGDLHTPQGAIDLTWYHNSSTRVFRNMRFLISSAPNCDMIISAQSIQKEKILSVPCLVANPLPDQLSTREVTTKDTEKETLDLILNIVKGALNDKRKAKEKGDLPDIIEKLKKEVEVVTWALELHEIYICRKKCIPCTGDISEEQLWKNIESDYPEISHELSEQLNRILVDLRRNLGHDDIQDAWTKSPLKWWSKVDYRKVNKTIP